MTTDRATKKCPFCAEEILADAVKCRFCGEMLDGAGHSGPRAHTMAYETKEFVIPIPDGEVPKTTPLDPTSDTPFPKEYLRAMGLNKIRDIDRMYRPGLTYVWDYYSRYFLERLNELGSEGWELSETFDPQIDERGFLVDPARRFEFETAEVGGVFGARQRIIVAGARFMMRRASG